MQCGLLYLPVHMKGFTVPEILHIGAIHSFVNCKLVVKLPATVQTTMPLIVILPIEGILVATPAIQLDILIIDFI